MWPTRDSPRAEDAMIQSNILIQLAAKGRFRLFLLIEPVPNDIPERVILSC